MDNKYQRGKIYKLVSSQTDKIYIGSTIQTLKQRKSKHKNKPCRSREITCYEDFDIILIKEYPCNCKKELLREEGDIIKQNLDICVNYQIAGRTKKEHLREVGIEYNKKYNIENRELINEKKRNKKYYCECCKNYTCYDSKARHLKSKKHQSNSARYNLI